MKKVFQVYNDLGKMDRYDASIIVDAWREVRVAENEIKRHGSNIVETEMRLAEALCQLYTLLQNKKRTFI